MTPSGNFAAGGGAHRTRVLCPLQEVALLLAMALLVLITIDC